MGIMPLHSKQSNEAGFSDSLGKDASANWGCSLMFAIIALLDSLILSRTGCLAMLG